MKVLLPDILLQCSAVAPSSNAARPPKARTGRGMTFGVLMRTKAAAQSPAPAAKDGALASSDIAEPESTKAWPAMNTKNPAASSWLPRPRKWTASNAAATMRAIPSTPHARPRKAGDGAKLPAKPRSAPTTRQMGATTDGRSVDILSSGRRCLLDLMAAQRSCASAAGRAADRPLQALVRRRPRDRRSRSSKRALRDRGKSSPGPRSPRP